MHTTYCKFTAILDGKYFSYVLIHFPNTYQEREIKLSPLKVVLRNINPNYWKLISK